MSSDEPENDTTTAATETAKVHYAVNLWGSFPEEGNDDCYTGVDYTSLVDAVSLYAALVAGDGSKLGSAFVARTYFASTVCVELARVEGNLVETLRVERTPHAHAVGRRILQARREERLELATQAGMAFGVDAYNDAMGAF